MGAQEQRFLQKKNVDLDKVMYITRDGRKSAIHLEDGRLVETFHTLQGITEDAPDAMFESINRGIVIASKYVKSAIDNVYTMTDGTEFKGRVRVSKEQKNNAIRYNKTSLLSGWEHYAILDNMPIAFCVIELVFDENNHGVDFIFKYCNHEMEIFEGKSINEMMNKSFYEVFDNGDKRWLAIYTDVAVNGNSRVIESFSPEIDSAIRVYCYQPQPNFCACLLKKI